MRRLLLGLALTTVLGCLPAAEDLSHFIILPEQRTLDIRDPSMLKPAAIPPTVPPRTVADPRPDIPEWRLSLDDAIRIALENARVIRVLAGVEAANSGRTVYDAAITNTTIDQANARFDPVLSDNASFNHTEFPSAALDPLNLGRSYLAATPTDDFRNVLGVQKTNVLGGQWGLTYNEDPTRFHGLGFFPLNPFDRRSVELSYTQPLLQGAGFAVNTAPIVIARLNTELSFFQYKDSVQELVRSVIEAYWNLVLARTTLWARKVQVQQAQETFDRETARLKTGFGKRGDLAQARVTLNQFKATLVAAEADVLLREDAVRNLLYLPPEDGRRIVPVSPPTSQRLNTNWDELIRLAEQRRPDIVELKIIVEADQQRLIQARNQALPRLDAVALYRWNGLSGTMPNGEFLSSRPGEFTDWTVGVNFSVPLGLRQGRAGVRQQELVIARDQANVAQGIHAAVHELAQNIRDLESAYEQYLAYKETRAAAYDNLQVQIESFRAGLNIYLDVLRAQDAWGSAVISEAQSLMAYNVLLATLERRTGTILETHGLVFLEERFRAAGPLGKHHPLDYPAATPPGGETHRYPGTDKPSEDAFDLKNPVPPRGSRSGDKDAWTPPAPKPVAPDDDSLPPPRRVPPGGLPPAPADTPAGGVPGPTGGQ